MKRPPRTYRVSEGTQALIVQISASVGLSLGEVIEHAVLAFAMQLSKEGKAASGSQEAAHAN